ncbi:MAG: hypothetical protein OEU92_21020 [Alphaproteobacteria bacterium]|nr:hypothetical protein [Alphaproteobacteria bacterium]
MHVSNGIQVTSQTTGDNGVGQGRTATPNAEEFSQILQATANGDNLKGGGNADLILGGTGNDVLDGGGGDDFLDGGEGKDVLDGGDGNDFLDGGTGDDTIIADNAGDEVRGGEGDDTIFASNDRSLAEYRAISRSNRESNQRNDTIPTGTLKGGSGDDTYVLGSGTHVIEDTAGSDTIKFENGTFDDFDFARNGDTLTITSDGTSVILRGQFANSNGVENIEFVDGSRFNLGDLLAEE